MNNSIYQGTKKFNFPACPSGKLYPRCTSPVVIFTSLKIFDVLQCSCELISKKNFPENFCLPIGQVKDKFH